MTEYRELTLAELKCLPEAAEAWLPISKEWVKTVHSGYNAAPCNTYRMPAELVTPAKLELSGTVVFNGKTYTFQVKES